MNMVDTSQTDFYKKEIELIKLSKLMNIQPGEVLEKDYSWVMQLYCADCSNSALQMQIQEWQHASK